MRLNQWRETAFSEGSRPTLATLYRWIEGGRFPPGAVRRIGKRYFVDTERINADANKVQALMDRVLRKAS